MVHRRPVESTISMSKDFAGASAAIGVESEEVAETGAGEWAAAIWFGVWAGTVGGGVGGPKRFVTSSKVPRRTAIPATNEMAAARKKIDATNQPP